MPLGENQKSNCQLNNTLRPRVYEQGPENKYVHQWPLVDARAVSWEAYGSLETYEV